MAGEPVLSTKSRPLRGWTRTLVRLAWWNVFQIGALIFVSVLFFTEQGAELFAIAREGSNGVTGAFVSLVGPALILASLAGGVAGATAFVGRWSLTYIAQDYGIEPRRVVAIGVIAFPTCLMVAVMGLLMWATSNWGWLMLAVAILAVGAVSFRSGLKNPEPEAGEPRATWVRFLVKMLLAVVLIGLMSAWLATSVSAARAVGALGVAMFAVGSWSAVLTLLFVTLPLGFRLTSLAVLAPAIWLIAGILHDPDRFPRSVDGIPLEPLSNLQPRTSWTPAFATWLLQFEGDPEDRPIIVYLISAEGGGQRAAYWTARVLAELEGRTKGRFGDHAFAYSGVSGGSLGIAVFLAARMRSDARPERGAQDIEAFLGQDFLAPLVGRLLVIEPWWQLLGSKSGAIPRDVAFEHQWNDDWRKLGGSDFFSRPLLATLPVDTPAHNPLVFFNSTNVESGKRFVVSNAFVEGYLPDAYFAFESSPLRNASAISVAEAVHLSSRFPYLSPPASLSVRLPDQEGRPVYRLWGRLVDGGYFDNSGGLSIWDLYRTLETFRDGAINNSGRFEAPPLQRIKKIAARVKFHVIVLRNDPEAMFFRLGDFPSHRRVQENRRESPIDTSHLRDGSVASLVPRMVGLTELLSPPQAMLSTREARGSATRSILKENVLTVSHKYAAACMQDSLQQHARLPFCVNAHDEYFEISLSEAIAIATQSQAGSKPSPCMAKDSLPSIALGWELSKASQRVMSCLTRNNGTIAAISGFFRMRQ